MAKKIHRPQLRRCGFCTKVGHNKSTCSFFLTKKKPDLGGNPAPVHFFVHHVTEAAPASPHIVDLKHQLSPIWNTVEAASPKKSTNPRYHFYHQNQKASRGELLALQAIAKNAERVLEHPEPRAIHTSFAAPLHTSFKKIAPTAPEQHHPKQASAQNLRNQFRMLAGHGRSLPQTFKTWQQNYEAATSALSLHLENKAYSLGTAIKKVFTVGPSKRSIAFALLVIIVIGILPLPARSYYVELQKNKQTVVDNSTAGFKALQNSTHQILAADLLSAEGSTHQALAHFDSALTTLKKYSWLETIVGSIPVVNNEITSREKLLLAGQQITVGNSYLLSGINTAETASTTPLQKINQVLAALTPALPNYEKAFNNLTEVDAKVLPNEYQDSFEQFRTLFGATVNDLKSIASLSGPLNEIFGGQGLRRYLITFQNPSELRPTGGFVGSFAVVEVKDGTIINITVPPGGSYDLQGQLDQFVEPPTPLLLANKRWEFQDANWFPDFKASSEKMLWFYRHSRGVTLDGVIAVNATVLTRLLSIGGPITDSKRGVTLSADTALPLLQQIVEEGPEKKLHKPKQILGDLVPTLIKNFSHLSAADSLALLKNIEDALGQKEIQAYFTDAATEESIASFGWSGQITQTLPNQDYVFVVNTNIQGQKSDAKIEQKIQHEAIINDDGSIVDTVTITRTHQGESEEKLYGAPNIDYLRVYVPAGSQLLSAAGFTWPDEAGFRAPESWYKPDSFLSEQEKLVAIDSTSGTHTVNEFNKTSFGNWIITPAGQTSQVQFSYRLPFTIFDTHTENKTNFFQKLLAPKTNLANYQLVAQRQSGSVSSFTSQIIFPTDWKPITKNGNEVTLASNGAEIIVPSFEHDAIWGIVMKQ